MSLPEIRRNIYLISKGLLAYWTISIGLAVLSNAIMDNIRFGNTLAQIDHRKYLITSLTFSTVIGVTMEIFLGDSFLSALNSILTSSLVILAYTFIPFKIFKDVSQITSPKNPYRSCYSFLLGFSLVAFQFLRAILNAYFKFSGNSVLTTNNLSSIHIISAAILILFFVYLYALFGKFWNIKYPKLMLYTFIGVNSFYFIYRLFEIF